jgi:hypothetical protein
MAELSVARGSVASDRLVEDKWQIEDEDKRERSE